MAATVSIKQFTGSGPTATSISNLRFCLADAANDGSAHSIQAPGSGSVQSFVAVLSPNADTAPTTGINNVKFYTSGTNPWSGPTLQASKGGTYTQATGTTSTGTVLNSTNFPGTSTAADAFTYTSASPLALSGSIAAATGRVTSDYLFLQMTVPSTTVQGILAQSTAYVQYDES